MTIIPELLSENLIGRRNARLQTKNELALYYHLLDAVNY